MPNSRVTTDPTDERLTRGIDNAPVEQNQVYLVLSEDERAKGYVRPFRNEYYHVECPLVKNGRIVTEQSAATKMGFDLSATYARDPDFYGATYCVHCQMHKPVSEFRWSKDHEVVGS